MAALLGLPTVTSSGSGSGFVRFNQGTHGSFLSPAANPAVTIEMQTQMATFAATNGAVLPITDASVIDGAEATP